MLTYGFRGNQLIRHRPTLKTILSFCVGVGFLACASDNQGPVDYRLLSGTWSEPGSCSSSLRIFTPEGRYFWLREEDDAWEVKYHGVFVTDSVATRTLRVPGAIFIAEQPASDAGSALLAITELTRDRLVVEVQETDSDESGPATYSWVRCSPPGLSTNLLE